MSVTGLHWHDAAFAVASDGSLLSSAPSVVHADPAQPARLGQPALDVARLSPRAVSAEHWAAVARDGAAVAPAHVGVARAELAQRLDASHRATPLQCAVSANFDDALGTLLALAQLEGLRVGGLHDSAALAVAAAGVSSTTLVLELGLAHFAVTRVECLDGEARRREAVVRRGAGLLALQQKWLRMIADAMVLATRFDPLHDGSSEQRLFDALEAAAARAAATGSCVIELPAAGELARLELGRDRFIEAAADLLRGVVSAVHELRPAGQRVNILFDESLLRWPGLLEKLAELRGCRLLTHAQGLIARAASLASGEADAAGAVTVQRGHSLAAVLEPAREVDLGDRGVPVTLAPTHALWEGRAFALPTRGALEIGRSALEGGIRLAEGLTGVSRLHCSLRAEAGQVTLVPHSAQPTWLNDERVRERVRVLSGDRLRLGSPGVVIELIAVGGVPDGASPQR